MPTQHCAVAHKVLLHSVYSLNFTHCDSRIVLSVKKTLAVKFIHNLSLHSASRSDDKTEVAASCNNNRTLQEDQHNQRYTCHTQLNTTLSPQRWWGHCNDDVSTIKGGRNGVATLIADEEPYGIQWLAAELRE